MIAEFCLEARVASRGVAHVAIALLVATAFLPRAEAVSCPVASKHDVSEAEQEFLRGNFDHAATLYRAELQKTPNDAAQVAGLTQVLLRQQKVMDADALVSAALATAPNSAVLLTALGEVQYREGTPWLASESAIKASKADPCYPRLHLLNARILRLNSAYAGATKELNLAHSLDPLDPDVRRLWLDTLPLSRRIAELEAYLGSDTGGDAEDTANGQSYLASMKKQLAEPRKECRLVSDATVTQIPFIGMMGDSHTVHFYGLDVKLDGRDAHLQIDTGASGLVVSRSVAEHAHLTRFTTGTSGGIGGNGETASYSAYVNSIRIGGLEFHDCQVEVIDSHNMQDIDGLIGMDVFSNFLVTLDFPLRQLALGTLPRRPDDASAARPSLRTAQSGSRNDDDDDAAKPAGGQDRYIAPEMKDWTRVYRVGHELIIPTALNGSSPKLFILDTGAFATTISPSVARSVTKVRGGSGIEVHGVAGKVDKVSSADNIEFTFGNLRQKVSDVVAFESPTVSKYAGMEIAGFIGATTLGQVAMSIDYRDGLVKFVYDPNRGYKYPGVP